MERTINGWIGERSKVKDSTSFYFYMREQRLKSSVDGESANCVMYCVDQKEYD